MQHLLLQLQIYDARNSDFVHRLNIFFDGVRVDGDHCPNLDFPTKEILVELGDCLDFFDLAARAANLHHSNRLTTTDSTADDGDNLRHERGFRVTPDHLVECIVDFAAKFFHDFSNAKDLDDLPNLGSCNWSHHSDEENRSDDFCCTR